MKTKLILCFLFCTSILVGCLADEPSKEVGAQVQESNEKNKPEEIELSDFSIIKKDTGYIYSLFGDIYDTQNGLVITTPETIYDHPYGTEYSWLAQKWSNLYIKWISGSGAILRIVVNEKGYVTRRGIGLGDSRSKIVELYGEDPGYISKDEIEFDLGNEEYETMMALIFYLENDIVVKIEIMQGL